MRQQNIEIACRRLREDVAAFAESEVRPRIAGMEASRAVDPAMARLIAQQGWIGITVPTKFGGMGLGHLAKTVIIEGLARVSGASGAIVQASQLGVAGILHFGSEKQKRRWLPAVATGACLPTIAVTEPGSGGHVLGMETRAVRYGDEYVLTGRKVFVGNSHVGDVHKVVVRTGPGSRGLSAFLVEADRPGVSLGAWRPALGLHGFSFGEIVLDDCRVPVENRLGDEGQGLDVAYSSSVLYGRLNLAAVALGIHRAVVEDTVAFATGRQRYGQALSSLPTVMDKLGRMQSRLMTARLAVEDAAQRLDRGLPCDGELMNAKLVSVELALDSARAAMEIHAASGLMGDLPVERYLRDLQHLYAPAGTSDVQVLRLAQVALGTAPGPQWSERFAAPAASAWGGEAAAAYRGKSAARS
ncbi:acyl-CoA dehydrogenase family protein [Streptomyces sp. NPDC005706]|uniref:acyl-CoA dehydrogenase family protein n=1 Tax=Streptomyces sp. NPDC005706 TaxID=3157169 RepID=UPI0034044CA9